MSKYKNKSYNFTKKHGGLT